jgi:signal transduction histidine kinase
VKLLGGKIWLDVKYINGSRFIFELPKKQMS